MAKFDNIVITSDMDGTFFGYDSRIVPENIEAIEYFNKNGGKFTFVTGRNHPSVIHEYPELVKYLSAPVAFHNGACIYDTKTDKVLFSQPLDNKLLRDLLNFLMDFYPDINATLRCSTGFYVVPPWEFEPWFYKVKDFCHTISMDKLDTIKVDKVVFVGDEEKFPYMRKLIHEKFGDSVDCTSAGASSVELMPHGIHKGYAVNKLRALPSLSGAKFFAIGDYENDIEMLEAADVAACPDNALDRVKEKCSIHACHHDKGAIADLIRIIEEKYIG